jgi:hypothetical protein
VTAPIFPGSTIGVLGGGQLGRMFAMAARRLGYRVHTLSPEHDTPTGQIADVEIRASYDDLDRVREFARGVDVVTFEFENVPAAAARRRPRCVPSGRAVAPWRLRSTGFANAHFCSRLDCQWRRSPLSHLCRSRPRWRTWGVGRC